jgi:phospholipid transport system substrate-binding protein
MNFNRRSIIVAAVAMALPLPALSQSQDVGQAQAFVATFTGKAVETLLADGIDQQEAAARFRTLLNEGFDVGTIGRFVLGRYLRELSDADLNAYLSVFEDYLVQVYSSRLSEFQDLGFKVVDARAIGKTDVLVGTTAVRGAGGSAARVDWRVRAANGAFRVVDVVVEGVSMSTSQRDDFSSIIQRGGGKVQVLIDTLRERTTTG